MEKYELGAVASSGEPRIDTFASMETYEADAFRPLNSLSFHLVQKSPVRSNRAKYDHGIVTMTKEVQNEENGCGCFQSALFRDYGRGSGQAGDGNHHKAWQARMDFVTLRKGGDPDISILKEAKAEYSKLQ
ncbi:MAG: hypothetical protein WCB14_17960 [Candidatus Acidiferrales bacterium]